MGVFKNRGTPKWMVRIMENPIKMDDLGVPLFSETSMSKIRFLAQIKDVTERSYEAVFFIVPKVIIPKPKKKPSAESHNLGPQTLLLFKCLKILQVAFSGNVAVSRTIDRCPHGYTFEQTLAVKLKTQTKWVTGAPGVRTRQNP